MPSAKNRHPVRRIRPHARRPRMLDPVPVRDLERAVRATLASEHVHEGEISLTLLADAEIRELNRTYLNRDRPTDVIAFALAAEGAPLGDVYVGYEQAVRQAREAEVPLNEELVRLAVHGTLHVLGHEHPEGAEREASEMFRRQEELVRRLLGEAGG